MQDQEKLGNGLNQEEVARYARHLALPEIGITGQTRLKSSSVLCIGSGGLGSPLLVYLAAAGVGNLGIVDFDLVEESNLQRQIIHGTSWLKKPKTISAKSRIKEINPYCKVKTFESLLNKENALKLIKPFDLICDCTDNFASRYLINDACLMLKKPMIYGAVAKFEGQATVFNLDKNSPNYRDLVPEAPPAGMLPSCAEGGVMGIVPGIIGLIQATEAIKIITQVGKPLNGRLLVFNALDMSFKELTLTKGAIAKNITDFVNYQEENLTKGVENRIEDNFKLKSISVQDLKELINSQSQDFSLIDVRTANEYKVTSINGAELIPLQGIENGDAINRIRNLSQGRQLYVYCQRGNRSAKALAVLHQYGIKGINLLGGVEAWNKEL